jgi:hypothetical protein
MTTKTDLNTPAGITMGMKMGWPPRTNKLQQGEDRRQRGGVTVTQVQRDQEDQVQRDQED